MFSCIGNSLVVILDSDKCELTTFLQTCKQFPLCISLWYLNAHSSQLEWPLSFISLCLNMLINNSCSLLMYHLGHQGWK